MVTLQSAALRHNGRMTDSRAPQQLLTPAASPEEAAAITAALETFMRATAPTATAVVQSIDPWQRAAILEGVSREPEDDVPDPWINT
jgi:hypothetical protein